MITKPLVHNYAKYVEALERIRDLEEKNRRLKEENTDLKIRLNVLGKDVPTEVLRVWSEMKEGTNG